VFPLNTILAWNINIIINKKYDNNNIIIVSRAYFLQSPTCTRVNNLVNTCAFNTYGISVLFIRVAHGKPYLRVWHFQVRLYLYILLRHHTLLILYEMASYKLGLLVRPQFLGRDYVVTIVIQLNYIVLAHFELHLVLLVLLKRLYT
jgi:hypothetical protein